MKVLVLCTPEQQQEIESKQSNASILFLHEASAVQELDDADMVIDLVAALYKHIQPSNGFLYLVNAVTETLHKLPANAVRINGWNTFLKRDIWEVAAPAHLQEKVQQAFDTIGWKIQFAPDEPGMIAPRVIAMIVNEAYFGLEDNISTKQEIDTAMKLGTNYPLGPFEWSEKIGLKNILSLLQKLAEQDKRYTPSQLLIQEANAIVA